MGIIKAKVRVKGTRPILWHVFGPESIPLEKQERTGVAGNNPEEWRKSYLATPKGQLYIPSTYAFASMREGSRHTKSGKGSIMKKVQATLQVIDDEILLDRFLPKDIHDNPEKYYGAKTEPVYIDVCGVVNPSNRARHVRYRLGASKGWECEFTCMWENTIVSRQQMEAVAIDAGILVGLADGRSVGFGRFEVLSFDIFEDAKKKTA